MPIKIASNDKGDQIALVDNQWLPVQKTASNDKGQNAYLVNNKWIVDEVPAKSTDSQRSWMDTLGEAVTSIPSSAGHMLGGLYETVTHPVQSAKAMTKAVGGGLTNIANAIAPGAGQYTFQLYGFSPEQVQTAVNTANQFGGVYKDRYGSEEALKRTLATDPVGAAGDLSMLFGGGAGVARAAGAPAKVANALSTAAQVTNPFAVLTTPVVTKPLGMVMRGGARAAGTAQDFLAKQSPVINARNMLREAAGENIAGIQAANAANPNALASTAAVDAANPTYQALLKIGESKDPANVAYLTRETQKADELAALQRAAGGATQTEARAVRDRSKAVIDEITRPMRERSLELADIGGTRGVALGKEAEQASKASSAAVEDVRRFTAAARRAEEMARTWEPSTGASFAGQPRPPVAATYPGELAVRAEQTATRRAGESLAAGETRREAELRMASLKAAGLNPLKVEGISDSIRQKLSDPNVRANPDAARALTNINSMLEQFADSNGVIRAEALYAIRKNGVNNVIEQLTREMDPAARKRFAAQVSTQIKPLIDNAIEQAGGKGWRDYLRTFESGMADIERKELLGRAMEVYQQSPEQFVRLIEGNNPSEIESILGPGKYDVVQELQSQLGPLQDVVQNIQTRAKVGERASAGATAASDVLQRNLMNGRIPNFLSPKIAVTNAIIAGLEGVINQKTLNVLIEASKSGKNANEVLNTLPAIERNKVLKYLMSNPQLSNKAKTSAAAAALKLSTANALSSTENNNSLMEQQ